MPDIKSNVNDAYGKTILQSPGEVINDLGTKIATLEEERDEYYDGMMQCTKDRDEYMKAYADKCKENFNLKKSKESEGYFRCSDCGKLKKS